MSTKTRRDSDAAYVRGQLRDFLMGGPATPEQVKAHCVWLGTDEIAFGLEAMVGRGEVLRTFPPACGATYELAHQ